MPLNNLPPLIPREILFGNPERVQPRISPDGSQLSFIAPVDGVLNVWVGPSAGSLEDFAPITQDRLRGIRFYFWAQDSSQIIYLQDTGGDENWRLFSVDIAAGTTRDLTPFDNVQARVLDVSKRFPTRILIALNKDDPRAHDVYSLDLVSGEITQVLKNPGNQVGWGIDPSQLVRTATVALPDGGSQLLVRDPTTEDSAWTVLVEWSPDDALSSGLAGFTEDCSALYLIDSTGVNAGRLVKRSLTDGTVEGILADPDYDVGHLIQHPDTYELQAVSVTRDKTEWTYFDPEFAADFDELASKIAGEISLASRDRDDQLWVISAQFDTKSPAYYLFSRQDKTLRFLFSARPSIDSYQLAPMAPISFVSRDGLTIHGYLSTPVDTEKKDLPLILNVHGGPWTRDGWGLSPDVQWMANRGYGVLQVNYRGSTGYGKAFLNAGNKEWAGKMHDDLVDAVEWAVDQGIADKSKVAIYGGSYGGYAALVGATFTPDLFCCAVDIVGPSNLLTLIASIPPYWAPMLSTFTRRVGDPATEEEFLKSRSPLFKVDQIKAPLLIAQGANDPRVKQAEAEQIVQALNEKKIDHTYLLFPDEGHGFARPENRLKFYAAAELFLAKHLGGRIEDESREDTDTAAH